MIFAGLSILLGWLPTALAGSHDDKVASLNLTRAVSMTDEGRYEFEKLSKRLEPQQKELKDMSAEIEELKQRLNSQASSTSDADRASLRGEIEVKEKLFERLVTSGDQEPSGSAQRDHATDRQQDGSDYP